MADEVPLADGMLSFESGQDAHHSPDKIQPTAYALGVNVSCDNNNLSPRWGIAERDLILPDGTLELPDHNRVKFDMLFNQGRFQAAAPYSIGSQYYHAVVISGNLFLVNQDTYEVTPVPIDDGTGNDNTTMLDESAYRINWSVAGRFLVFHDWPANPVILEGTEARRADPALFEVPVSVLGVSNSTRFFIANNGNEFTGGDPEGSLAAPDAPITFQEVLIPSAAYFGQVFQVTTNYSNDPITAMASLQVADTSTGIGPLLVSTQSKIKAYGANSPRASWSAEQFGSEFVYASGIAGPRALTNLNSDLLYLDSEGQLRSLAMSRDEQRKWSKVPMSLEVSNWLKFWDPSLVRFAAMAYFENKVLITANPYRTTAIGMAGNRLTDFAHGGFVVLELDGLSALSGESPPVWAGLWTGVHPMEIITNNKRLFVYGKKNGRTNTLYEFTPEDKFDVIDGKERSIISRINTKQFDFKDPFMNKETHSIDFDLSSVMGDFCLDIKYKPSHSAGFLPWNSFRHTAPFQSCDVPSPNEINGFSGHQFRELTLSAPSDDSCDPVTRELFRTFRKVQFQFTIEGRYWELHGFKVKAITKAQSLNQEQCEKYPTVILPRPCVDDWDIKQVCNGSECN